jgi:hypothetical protein
MLLTLKQALNDRLIAGLPAGHYSIEYWDKTHSEANPERWTALFDVDLRRTPESIASEAHSYYELALHPNFSGQLHVPGHERQLCDALAQVLLRVALMQPLVGPEGLRDILDLKRHQAVVLVPDTNALSNGTMQWLVQALAPVQVWMLPVAISLTTAQRHDEHLKALWRNPLPRHLPRALRSRGLISGMLGFLRRHEDQYQVIEVDPQLLRYFAPPKGGSDPDEGDVLEDRLFIEAIHGYFRTTRSRGERRVVTSDVFLTRVLEAEGIPVLSMNVPVLSDTPLRCLRYDPLASAFAGAPLLALLWELSHTFASIRLKDQNNDSAIELRAHWPNKSGDDWRNERLNIDVADVRTDPLGSPMAPKEGPAPAQPSQPMHRAYGPERQHAFTSARLPAASFLAVLRLGGAVLAGSTTLPNAVEAIQPPHRPSEEVARMAAEFLWRAGFLHVTPSLTITPDRSLHALDEALLSQDLDPASALLTRFAPYMVVLEALKSQGSAAADEMLPILSSELGDAPSKEAVDRLVRVPVYLGQAWTDGPRIRNGANRPTKAQLASATSTAFDQLATDGLCAVGDLLPHICRELLMSPWAAGRALSSLVETSGT